MGQVYQATDTKLNRQVALRRTGRRAQCWSVVAVMYLSVLLVGCADPWSDAPVLTADLPLHLEDHLDAATIEGSEVPADRPAPVEWRFDEPQPGWQPVDPIPTDSTAVTPVRIEDALHLPVTEDMPHPTILRVRQGYIYVELPDWRLEEWAYVEISARASEGMRNMGLFFNRTEEDSPDVPFHSFGAPGSARVGRHGPDVSVVTGVTPTSVGGAMKDLGIWFNSPVGANHGDARSFVRPGDPGGGRVRGAKGRDADGGALHLAGSAPPKPLHTYPWERRVSGARARAGPTGCRSRDAPSGCAGDVRGPGPLTGSRGRDAAPRNVRPVARVGTTVCGSVASGRPDRHADPGSRGRAGRCGGALGGTDPQRHTHDRRAQHHFLCH